MVKKKTVVATLDEIIELFFFAAWVFIPTSIGATNVSLGICFFCWTLKRLISKDLHVTRTHINWLLFVLLVFAFLSFFNTVSLAASKKGIGKLLKYFFLFFIFVETMNTPRRFRRLTFAAISGLVIASACGIFQYVGGRDFIRWFPLSFWGKEIFGVNIPRIQAAMHNPNDFACYLIGVVPLALALFLYYPGRRLRLLFGLVSLAGLFNLFNTFYRGAALGLIVVLGVFSFIKRDIKPLVIVVLLVVLFLLIVPHPVKDWVRSNLNPYDFFVEQGGRRQHWQAAANMIKAHPLIGVGVNTFCLNYTLYKSANDPFVGWYAHNSYLQLGGEIGLIGLCVFLALCIVVIVCWLRHYRDLHDERFKAISLGFFGAYVGFLVAACFESSLQSSNLAVLFWLIVAAVVGLSSLPRESI